MEKFINKAAVLIEALPYMQEFRNETVVIKFGGSAMEDPELTKSTMRDIVFMESIGIKPIVVHGGGKAISAKLKEMNIPTKFINGLRYTCENTISVVDDVLHNTVNKDLLSAITAAGGKGVALSGKKFLKADKLTTSCQKTGKEIDLGFVGDISKVDTAVIYDALKNDMVPVIPPLAIENENQALNINADIAACKIAQAVHAKKLVFLSDVPGILKNHEDENSIISTITVEEISTYINDGIISGGMVPKIESAKEALLAGTDKVHIIDGRIQHSLLLEIFTDQGIGTQIIKKAKK